MPIQAQSADGVIHEFPDGTPDAVIDTAMADYARGQQPSTMEDIGKAAGPSLVRGGVALATTPTTLTDLAARGVDWAANKVLPEGAAQTVSKGAKAVEGALAPYTYSGVMPALEKVTGPLYEPKTTGGKIVGGALEFLPSTLLMGGGGMGARALQALFASGGKVGADKLVDATGMPEWTRPYAEVAGTVAGGVAGPGVARKLVRPSPPISPEHTAAASALTSRGMPLSAGRQTGGPILNRIEGGFSQSMGAPKWATPAGETENFTKVATKSTGATADNPQVLNPTTGRTALNEQQEALKAGYDNLFNNAQITYPPNFRTSVEDLVKQYKNVAGAQATPDVEKAANMILLGKSGQPMAHAVVAGMDGARYQFIKDSIENAIAGATTNAERTILTRLKTTLDGALQSNLSPAERSTLSNLDRNYANLRVVAKTEQPGGLIEPKDLAATTKKHIGKEAYNLGKGPEIADVARAGERVLPPRPVPTGDFARPLTQVLSAGVGGLLGGAAGGVEPGLVGAILGKEVGKPLVDALLGKNPLAARAYYSKPVQAYLKGSWLPEKFAMPGAGTKLNPKLAASLLSQASVPRLQYTTEGYPFYQK